MNAAPAVPLAFEVLRQQVILDHPAFSPPVQQALGRHRLGPSSTTLHIGVGEADCEGEPNAAAPTLHGPLPLVVQGNEWALAGGRVRGRFGAPDTELAFPLSPTPLEGVAQQLALHEAGRVSGLLPLHAAVLSRQGRAVALFGDSGAGKSTAALRLLGLGWTLVAEDSAWLCPETGQIAGAGSGLRVRRESLEHFAPDWLDQELIRDVHGKYVLPFPTSGPVPLEHVYLLSQTASPLTAATAIRHWWAATGLPVTPLARQAVARGLGEASRRFPLESVDRDALIERLS